MTEDEAKAQLQARLAGLDAAGIGWIPRDRSPRPAVVAEAVVTEEPDGLASRVLALKVLADTVAGCTRCPELAATRSQTVFGVGPVGADILFIGEAPGQDEDRVGEPFVGAAGKMLDRIIAGCGLKREEIFICNILRCRPPGNRQPKTDEAANCREWLDGTIALVQPKVIVCWGGVAATNVLNTTTGITRLRGKTYEYEGVPVICTFHPEALLEGRNPEKKKEVWEDMKVLLKMTGRPIPSR